MIVAPLVLRWRLAPGMSLVPLAGTDLRLATPTGDDVTLTPRHTGLRDALLALLKGATEAALGELAGGERTAALHYYLARMAGRGVVEASADLDDVSVLRLLPCNDTFELPSPSDVPPRVTLDRFAFLRRGDRGGLLGQPDAGCDVLVEQAAAAALVARLAAGPVDVSTLEGALDRPLAALLFALGFAGDAAAVEDPSRRTWEFHDRLFQRASRSYDDQTRRGATHRFLDTLPSPPAIRPSYAGESIPLAPPRAGPSGNLQEVVERRRSLRAMSDMPVDLQAVGDLLHRVARVTRVVPGNAEMPQDLMRRPYPSGGAVHELEFYLAIGACAGLAPGFYHYRGREHALTRIAGAEAPAARMLDDCAEAWGQPGQPPQVLVVISSRLPRMAWKYAGIAYKLSLMNAGVAIQSLYLAATDLGLAAAAAGTGNPELFARATGVSSWEETSIAEFGFGRPA